jgi:2-oxoglutarate dehydrogenase E1 component
MESDQHRTSLSRESQLRCLSLLTDAEVLEEFIRKRFVGAKSYSLEGAESLIPLLGLAIDKAADQDVREIVLAMAHRGRLNILANIMGKSPEWIFREFRDTDPEASTGRGDVKYHLGHSTEWTAANGQPVHLSLCFNPSHLEFVNPVALGRMRAKQDRAGDTNRTRGLTVMIHGDASLAGEGVTQETLNLSQLGAYSTGGTLHIVVNNRIGFTTPPSQATSSYACTDVAKMLQIPIFHVNGEDIEAVARAVHIAMDFRRTFKTDVFIDLVCYRRFGHNETDEPSFTQPLLYRSIEGRKTVREKYRDRLVQLGAITSEEAVAAARQRWAVLSQAMSAAETEKSTPQDNALRGVWHGYAGGPDSATPDVDTSVEPRLVISLLEGLARIPEGFRVHPKLGSLLERRLDMAHGKVGLDWATAEALAFASLTVPLGLTGNRRVRLSGQDTERGTFSQRHAVLHDCETGARYPLLQNLVRNQRPLEIFNSPLSEAGVLAFEYGYSLDCPEGLILWEAQFGDFWNAAQVVVDQFISSAEDKWRRLSGIVLLLPHGFEGSGPEHSSARLERFLSLAAEDNIQVVYPTTPAQYFHVLRRQVLRPWRKPLIVLTPKSFLRHPQMTSPISDFAQGWFKPVIGDTENPKDVRKIVLCSGKSYFHLQDARHKLGRQDVAIIRIEQLYPLRLDDLMHTLISYWNGTPAVWVQEEPENMGAWPYLHNRFRERLFSRFPFSVISRPASASPATGSASSHKREQERLIAEVFR